MPLATILNPAAPCPDGVTDETQAAWAEIRKAHPTAVTYQALWDSGTHKDGRWLGILVTDPALVNDRVFWQTALSAVRDTPQVSENIPIVMAMLQATQQRIEGKLSSWSWFKLKLRLESVHDFLFSQDSARMNDEAGVHDICRMWAHERALCWAHVLVRAMQDGLPKFQIDGDEKGDARAIISTQAERRKSLHSLAKVVHESIALSACLRGHLPSNVEDYSWGVHTEYVVPYYNRVYSDILKSAVVPHV